MYLPVAPGLSGVCARESKSSGAESRKKIANNRPVIFIRERILTLTIEVGEAQHAVPLRMAATSFLLPVLPAEPRPRPRNRLPQAAASERPEWTGLLREFRLREHGSLF